MEALLLMPFELVSLVTAGAMLSVLIYALYRKYRAVDEIMSLSGGFLPQSDQNAERRRARRIQAGAVLELKDESGIRVAGTAALRDLSSSGARFDSRVVLKRKQKFKARLRSPKDGGILELKAHVIWIKPQDVSHMYGIQFLLT